MKQADQPRSKQTNKLINHSTRSCVYFEGKCLLVVAANGDIIMKNRPQLNDRLIKKKPTMTFTHTIYPFLAG